MKSLLRLLALSVFGLSLPSFLDAALKTKTLLPEFTGITEWLNTESPMERDQLIGKVTLIDFWNYSNLQSLRKIPHLNQWYAAYKEAGFEIVGIHTPEFEFEKDVDALKNTLKKLKVTYPVALDPEARMWVAYNNLARPVLYLADVRGRIRFVHYGQGAYTKLEEKIRELLQESGRSLDPDSEPQEAAQETKPPKLQEIYLGYKRLSHFGNQVSLKANKNESFTTPAVRYLGRFYLEGIWRFGEDRLTLGTAHGLVSLRSSGGGLTIVAGAPASKEISVEIKVNGVSLAKEIKGEDLTIQNGKSYLVVKESRLYDLVPSRAEAFEVQMIVENEGLEIYKLHLG